MKLENTEFGTVNVRNVPLPEGICPTLATYTFSGTVLFIDENATKADRRTIYAVDDDGENLRVLYKGDIKILPKANGIRMMPFYDDKRVLLGDYVLECSPDINSCTSASLVPIEYPLDMRGNPQTFMVWSEPIIAMDNIRIAWTALRTDGAMVFIGKLKRERDRYIIEETQLISGNSFIEEDTENPGYLKPVVVRGGEIKQFVRGGSAISLVGAGKGCLPDSVVQDLTSDDVIPVTNSPGYDETTIFSMDERLGIVMSPRASKNTDLGVIGLVPRPLGMLSTVGITMNAYLYCVAGVRSFRKGNVGPVLIDIEKSINDLSYKGVALNDPKEHWVYYSPMSWHPGSQKVMWNEMERRSETENGAPAGRIRIAELPDYKGGPAIKPVENLSSIPYALPATEEMISKNYSAETEGKFAGKSAGYASFSSKREGITHTQYHAYSDDGKNVYDGYEKVVATPGGDCVYEADFKVRGTEPGEAKLRICFKTTGREEVRISFETGADGKPESYGYSTYGGKTLRVEDLSE